MISKRQRIAIYGSALGALLGSAGDFSPKAQAEKWKISGIKEQPQDFEMPRYKKDIEKTPQMPVMTSGTSKGALAAQQEKQEQQNNIKAWSERGNSAAGPDQFGQVKSAGQEQIIQARIWKKLDKWGLLGDVGKFFTQPMPEFWNQGTLNESFPAMGGKGHWCIEPMFFGSTGWGAFGNNGHHDTSKSANSGNNYTNLWWMAYSITDQLEVFIEPTYELNWNGGSPMGSPEAADLPFGIKYRTSSVYSPSLTLTLGGQAPTGRYDRLSNPNDGSGAGTWYFNFGVTMMYSIPIFGHPLISSIWASANQSTGDARIHGMSTYGTDSGFDGWASPSQFGSAGQGFEYGLTKKFGLALDLMGNWAAPTTVRGHDANGVWSKSKGQWSDQFQVVPGLEYAFSPNWGIVGQVSIPVVGRNTSANLTPEMGIVAYY